MFRCSKKGCGKNATSVVALKIYCGDIEIPAEVFATIFACSEEHQAPNGDIRLFFTRNWETLATGFEIQRIPRPILEKTEMAWVSIQDYEEYLREHAGAAKSFTMRKN
jgi:hypothetical protein